MLKLESMNIFWTQNRALKSTSLALRYVRGGTWWVPALLLWDSNRARWNACSQSRSSRTSLFPKPILKSSTGVSRLSRRKRRHSPGALVEERMSVPGESDSLSSFLLAGSS